MLGGVRSMRGRVIKKLKSISSLKQGLLFPTTASLPELYFRPLKESDKDREPEIESPGNSVVSETIIKDAQEPVRSHENAEEEFVPAPSSPESKGKDDDPVDSEALKLLQEFEKKCPPGGNDSVVLYTTSMRGIRKTFDECNSIRFLLESFRVEYNERDVSLHLEYRDELWEIMGFKAVSPRLFVRGRYIGGADEVVGLHEAGMLKKLMHGIPESSGNSCCGGCAGVRFVLCFVCNGSRKIVAGDGGRRCSECNENGLVKCPVCNCSK